MNTLELKGQILEIIGNTQDKSTLEKLYAFITKLIPTEERDGLSTDTISVMEARLDHYYKNPTLAIDNDAFIKQMEQEDEKL